jgi:hypothetical protein
MLTRKMMFFLKIGSWEKNLKMVSASEGKRQICREPCPLKWNEHQLGKLAGRP